MPGVSRTSFAQLHPFCVAWWYSKDGSDYIVLIIEKKNGFTKQLCSHRSIELNNNVEMAVLIEGPYGRELDLDSYGTVLLFATGIGIAAQLSYIWQLLNRFQTSQSRTKKIQLYWQVDREGNKPTD
jgi:NAD(P)H-flavin reductase